ncbi:MAG: hypothetical protein Q7V62_08180 [Actinomycetota bacterium]|nr:hypothetical protein [Actinomycetota bacterium]
MRDLALARSRSTRTVAATNRRVHAASSSSIRFISRFRFSACFEVCAETERSIDRLIDFITIRTTFLLSLSFRVMSAITENDMFAATTDNPDTHLPDINWAPLTPEEKAAADARMANARPPPPPATLDIATPPSSPKLKRGSDAEADIDEPQAKKPKQASSLERCAAKFAFVSGVTGVFQKIIDGEHSLAAGTAMIASMVGPSVAKCIEVKVEPKRSAETEEKMAEWLDKQVEWTDQRARIGQLIQDIVNKHEASSTRSLIDIVEQMHELVKLAEHHASVEHLDMVLDEK